MKNKLRYNKISMQISGLIFLVLSVLKLSVYAQKTWLFSEWYTNAVYAAAFGAFVSCLGTVILRKAKQTYLRREINAILCIAIFCIVKKVYEYFCMVHMSAKYFNSVNAIMLSLIAALTCGIVFLAGEKNGYYPPISDQKEKDTKTPVFEEKDVGILKADSTSLDSIGINFRFKKSFFDVRYKAIFGGNNTISKVCDYNAVEHFGKLSEDEEFHYITYKNMAMGYFLLERQGDCLYIKEYDVMSDELGKIGFSIFFNEHPNMKIQVALEEICAKELYENMILSAVRTITSEYKIIVDKSKKVVEFQSKED